MPQQYRRAAAAVAPSRADWDALISMNAAGARGGHPLVDVIVPVYRGHDETLRCLHTVLTSTCTTPHAVVVIDDASPDPELKDELQRLAGAGLIELLRNDRNSGFVATCNRGMSLHLDRDVVLLNSDTEVYGDWLDRLRAAVLGRDKVGSVTPLSNNATICSYPYFARDNDMALEASYADLDRLTARVNAGRTVTLPTGVGFCMYIRRECLDDVGTFDVERFGHGYGEENDFSLRARERGWTHLLACDVFVRHRGAISFGAAKDARISAALAKIAERFPDYGAQVTRFVQEDPPHDARARLDLARMAARTTAGAFLFVMHNWGGGAERHVQDLRRRLEAEGTAAVFLRPDPEQPQRAVLSHPSVWPAPNVGPFDLHRDVEPLIEALRELNVAHVHVHSLVGFDQRAAAEWVQRVSTALGVPYDFTVHDYVFMCPRINLVDASGVYCGEPGPETCQECVNTIGSPFGTVAVQEWRAAYERLLRGARTLFAPGEDAAARLVRHLPGVEPVVKPHIEDPVDRPRAPAERRGVREPLRVAVIGAIWPHKGYEVLRACAKDAAVRRLPIAFRLVGYSCDDEALKKWGNVSVLGRYDDAELPRLLADQRCHCAFFPSVWPETYSYTLSAAIAAGLHPISFDLGVPSERIRKLGWGTVIPLSGDPSAVNDALLSAETAVAPDRDRVRAGLTTCESVVRDYYGLSRALPPA
jgi:GT2 family glycosyltransferase/glycosyltransferase involved in cell wall biosynthesis